MSKSLKIYIKTCYLALSDRDNEQNEDCTNQQPPQRGGLVVQCLGWVEIVVGFSEGLNYLRHPTHTNHFFAVLPHQQQQKDCTQPL